MDITGKLFSIGEVKTFDSGFMVQEFYLDLTRYNQMTGQKYSNHAKFKIFKEKCEPEKFNEGDNIKVGFSINGKSFVKEDGSTGFSQDLVAYKMEFVREALKEAPQPVEQEQDDLPF